MHHLAESQPEDDRFIDSETTIERRKKIRDDIKTQTKFTTTKVSEYLHGSVGRLGILDVEEDHGLIRMTAKVAVRIEDFKHYTSETVLACRALSLMI